MRKILWEQIKNCTLMFRIAKYEKKSDYQNHYLGLLWQYVNPLIQIGIYYAVFGIGFRASSLEFILIGIIPWLFINNVVIQGAKSILNKLNLVSKMKFPLSTLPNITIISNLPSFLTMVLILIITLMNKGIYPNLYWIQLIYYFSALLLFLFAGSLLNAIISVIIPDYQIVLQSLMRVLFYATGIVWDVNNKLPEWIVNILKLNPFMYIINGFRDSLLYQHCFLESIGYTCYFWATTCLIFFLATRLYFRFKDRLVDFM